MSEETKKLSTKTKILGWVFIFFFVTGLLSCGVQIGVEVLPEAQTDTWTVDGKIEHPGVFGQCLKAIETEQDENGIINVLGEPLEIYDGEKRTLRYRYSSYPSGYKIWLLTVPIPIVNYSNKTGCDVHISNGKPDSATVYYNPASFFYGCIKKNDPTVPTRAEGCYSGAKYFDMYLTDEQRNENSKRNTEARQ